MATIKINESDIPKRIKVGDKFVGDGEPTYFIAEVGNNHNGDLELAKKTLREAARAGADAVKLQKRSVPEVFSKELLNRPQTKTKEFGDTYGEYRQNLELGMDEFKELKEYSSELDLLFFATPFDETSVDFLEEVGIEVYKISSFDVTNLPLLRYVAQKDKPLFMSLGLSTAEEADEAVRTVLKHNSKLVVNHCVSSYPTKDEDLNLNNILYLKKRYNPIPVGYSGHEQDILPSLIAIGLGATSIERHFTLDKSLPGPDHSTVSLEPDEFEDMVEQSSRVQKFLGKSEKELWEAEKPARKKHSKSLVTTVDIEAGSKLKEEMITQKSPGYGLKPNMIDEVVGKKIKQDITKDSVLTKDVIKWE